MRSILSTIKVAVYGVFLFLSLSWVITANTTHAKTDQSADRIGGQGGGATHLAVRRVCKLLSNRGRSQLIRWMECGWAVGRVWKVIRKSRTAKLSDPLPDCIVPMAGQPHCL